MLSPTAAVPVPIIRSLGLRAAIFKGSGACALGLLGSTGCEEFEDCGELEVCAGLEAAFRPLPVLLPGSGAAG